MNCAIFIRRRASEAAFTLLEVLLAATAAAIIFAAIYGIFARAITLRDNATTRIHDAQLAARATTVLRNDLRNAFVSEDALNGASALTALPETTAQGKSSRFPGYLRLTTTTAALSHEEAAPDVHEVAYYIADDPLAEPGSEGGVLVRAIDDDLTAPMRQTTREERLLAGAKSMEVSFFDGQSWSDSWSGTASTSSTSSTTSATAAATLPVAIRVRIEMAPPVSPKGRRQLPIEITMPWATEAPTL